MVAASVAEDVVVVGVVVVVDVGVAVVVGVDVALVVGVVVAVIAAAVSVDAAEDVVAAVAARRRLPARRSPSVTVVRIVEGPS